MSPPCQFFYMFHIQLDPLLWSWTFRDIYLFNIIELGTKGLCTLYTTLQSNEPVPQVLKQVSRCILVSFEWIYREKNHKIFWNTLQVAQPMYCDLRFWRTVVLHFPIYPFKRHRYTSTGCKPVLFFKCSCVDEKWQ